MSQVFHYQLASYLKVFVVHLVMMSKVEISADPLNSVLAVPVVSSIVRIVPKPILTLSSLNLHEKVFKGYLAIHLLLFDVDFRFYIYHFNESVLFNNVNQSQLFNLIIIASGATDDPFKKADKQEEED